jgi:pimeloyl-ACP methyl ester carboxylesterase
VLYIFQVAVLFFTSLYIYAIFQFIITIYYLFFTKQIILTIPAVWVFTDLVFIAYTKISFELKHKTTTHLPQANLEQLIEFGRELVNPLSVPDAKLFFQGWFKGVAFSEIGKHDLLSWISEMSFHRKSNEITINQLNECVVLLSLIEEFSGLQFKAETSTPMYSLTQDPIGIFHRPFIFYVATRAIDLGSRAWLYSKNFTRTDYAHIHSFIRVGKSVELPIVFFHGLGVGLASYIPFLGALIEQFPDRTFLFFEMPSIAMRATVTHCLPEKFVDSVALICAEMGFEKVYAVAHSFGTIVICWLDRYYPGLVEHRIFVDPVCFSLWTPHTMHNFLYRKPVKPHHYLFTYVAAMEPGTQLYLRRFFVWNINTYFTPNLPNNSTIFLAERDDIVDCKYVANYLNNFPDPTRKIIVMERHKHMQKLLFGKYQDIFEAIEKSR